MKKCLVVLLIVVLLMNVVGCGNKTKDMNELFKPKYEELFAEDERWLVSPFWSFDSDGNWMEIKTQPYTEERLNGFLKNNDFVNYNADSKSNELANTYAWDLIQQFNDELGMSAATKKMKETNALMGMQTQENDDYKISWSYHPDTGLVVLYEVNN